MTITIYDSVKPNKVIVENKRDKFVERYGHINIYVDKKDLFSVMQEMSKWVNNELKEECLFEIG